MSFESVAFVVGPERRPLRVDTARIDGRHPDGSPSLLTLQDAITLDTPWGPLVPRHTDDSEDPETRRPPRPAIELGPDGVLKSLSIETQSAIQTPLGSLPAERLLFHPDGSLRRLFPLDGKLSAYRTWQDEKELATVLDLTLPPDPNIFEAGPRPLRIRPISLLFYPSGALQSVSLWTGETLPFPTALGPIPARIGLSFHENGAIASLEPARPVEILSPVGPITVFDPDPAGVSGDVNSLAFTPNGSIERLTTATHLVRATTGSDASIAPVRELSVCSEEEEYETRPLTLCFRGDALLAGLGAPGASGVLPPTILELSLTRHRPQAAPAPGLPQPLPFGSLAPASCQS